MGLSFYLPFWEQLTQRQRDVMGQAAVIRRAAKGAILHNGSDDCVGLILVVAGRLRAYLISDEGREITLYHLLERDICLFSASCMLHSIQFDITVEAEEDTEYYQLSANIYQSIMAESASVANYTNEVMASRFSDVMWLMDQVLNKRMDSRLGAFLLEESGMSGSDGLKITHEAIARHLGSAREVVTRMLKYFQEEGVVTLSRGEIHIKDRGALEELARDSLR